MVALLGLQRSGVEDLVRGFRSNDVPLDVFVIDMDWHLTFGPSGSGAKPLDQSGHSKGWSGYSWNKLLFPDPPEFLKHIKEQGLKATLNMHPASGVQPWEEAYPAMARVMGIDPATEKYVPFDITNKQFATNYLNLLHHPLEKQGIDFWWIDWQQEMNTKTPGVNPTWWLNYVHFTDQERQNKRALLFHRWGGLGNHRYQIGFSGDTISVWPSLAFQPWFTATAANVGYAYWSHDIGGHMPGAVDPSCTADGFSLARSVRFFALTPQRIPMLSAASGLTPNLIRTSCAIRFTCVTRSCPTSIPKRVELTTLVLPSCIRSTTTGRKRRKPTRTKTSTCSEQT